MSKRASMRRPDPNDRGSARRQGQNQKGNSSQFFIHVVARILG
jgi:hypothetical protein